MNILLITLITFLGQADHIPEFKAALDFNQLNHFKEHIVRPIIELMQGTQLPIDIDVKQHIPLFGNMELQINEAYLNELNLNWDNSYIMPYEKSEDTIVLQLKSANISLQSYVGFKAIGWQMVKTNTTLKLVNLDFTIMIKFEEAVRKRSWGFKPIITDVQIGVKRLQVLLEHTIIPPQVGINAFIDLMTPMIVKQTRKAILKIVSPALATISQTQRLQQDITINNNIYQFGITFTQAPKIIYENNSPYLSIQMDIQIENLETGVNCPIFDTGDLPLRINSNQALEFIVGSNIVNQLLWTFIDSGLFDMTINDTQITGLPIQLTTNGLKLIIPDFYETYGSDKGIYLRIYSAQPTQSMYIRSGRILGAITVMMDFIVDTDSSNYPSKDCPNCIVAYTAEVKLGVMATIFNENNLFKGNVQLVKIIDIDQQGGEMTSSSITIMQTLNSLVGALLPSINADLIKGIKNPIIGFMGIKEIDVTMGDSFLALGLVLN